MKKTLLAIALMASMAGVSTKTVVTVNGEKIDSAVIDRQVSDLNKQSKGQIKDSPELRERLKQNAIVHTVIVQEAKKRKLDDSAEYKDFIKRTKDEADKRGESKKASFKQDFEDFKEKLENEKLPTRLYGEFENAPKLFPIFYHRYIPSGIYDDPPVFSIMGTDIIVYGKNISDWVQNEYYPESARIYLKKIKTKVPFWMSILDYSD